MSCQVMHHANNNPSNYYYHQHCDVISGRPEKSYHHPAEYYNPEKELPTTRKRRAHDFEKDRKQNDFEADRRDYEKLSSSDKLATSDIIKMNHTESVRSIDHGGQGLSGYEPLEHAGVNGGSGAGSPYISSHGSSHHQHHHHHLHSSHDSIISSHSVAALQRLSSTLEPSGDTNGDHGSGSTTSGSYHHHRTSPSHHGSDAKIRKMASQQQQHHHHQRDEDEVGSESDAGGDAQQGSSIPDDDGQVGRAQYLTANCVVFTYFRGDISAVVDDHFSRALSQSSTADKTKDFLPLSQRNLPASFWISNYQYPIAAATGSSSFSSFAHDLYHHHAHHAAAAAAAVDPYAANSLLGADVDPWQNYMAAAAGSAYSAAHHRAAHDMYHSSRLNPQYSSFLLQSSAAMRQAHGRAAAALGKAPHDSWAAAAAVASVGSAAAGQALENYAGSTHSHYGGMTGLEGTMQSSSKDLYWF